MILTFCFTRQRSQNGFCIKMGSVESRFNGPLIAMGKVTRQCPQTAATRDSRNRTDAVHFPSLTPYGWAKPACVFFFRDLMS